MIKSASGIQTMLTQAQTTPIFAWRLPVRRPSEDAISPRAFRPKMSAARAAT
jgi:hypothetical protein